MKYLFLVVLGILSLRVWSDGVDQKVIRSTRKNAVLIILDTSGSMYGEPLQEAKDAIKKSVLKLKPDIGAGLISFSGCNSFDIKLQVPLGINRIQSIVNQTELLYADGQTDISGALEMAEQEISKNKEDYCTHILLLSDGGHNCNDRDPVAIAQRLAKQYNDCTQLDVISSNTTNWEAELFDKMATVGKGNYKSLEEIGDLEKEMDSFLEKFFKEKKSLGNWNGDHNKKNKKPNKKGPEADTPPEDEDQTNRNLLNENQNKEEKKKQGGK